MADHEIDFTAAADLRKWPSLENRRLPGAAGPYLVCEGTLDACMQRFMEKPANTRHLYEIHTRAQGDLVSPVLSAAHIAELARLRDFL